MGPREVFRHNATDRKKGTFEDFGTHVSYFFFVFIHFLDLRASHVLTF